MNHKLKAEGLFVAMFHQLYHLPYDRQSHPEKKELAKTCALLAVQFATDMVDAITETCNDDMTMIRKEIEKI